MLSADGRRIRKKVSGKTRTEVKDKLKDLHSELEAGVRTVQRYTVADAWQEHGLVFTTSVGTVYESHNLRRGFRRVTAAAGLGARWVPKELRTSFVSMMSYQGVPSRRLRDQPGTPARGQPR